MKDIPKIKFENINKTFITRNQVIEALKNINLDIYEGEFISLIGPSGCGKSTVIRILDNMVEPTSGNVYIDNIKMSSKNIKKMIRNIGFIFQQPNLLPWLTVKENIELPLKIFNLKGSYWENKANELMSMFSVLEYSDSYPSDISGGVAQRIGVIRSMIYEPDILLMDEPFGALDAMTREILDIEVLDLWRRTKKTIIFITHEIEEAILVSQKIFVMGTNPGRITGTVNIDLEYPRNLEMVKDEKFIELEKQLRNMIGSLDLSKIK